MSTHSLVAQEYESIDATHEALHGMLIRLGALLDKPRITQQDFVEISAIFNNVSYVFLYLESNEVHVNYDRLLPLRDAFFKDSALDARLLRKISTLRCAEADVEAARVAFVDHLRGRSVTPDPGEDDRLARLQTEAKSVLRQTERDQARLLHRLGAGGDGARPEARFYKLVTGTPNPVTRAKLGQAWRRTRDQRLTTLLGIVDEMVAVRHAGSARRGHPGALAETLRRCRVREQDAATYLDRYLRRALDSHAALEKEIEAAVGGDGNAADHFGRYVATLVGDTPIPRFVLGDCLRFIYSVAERLFGLRVTAATSRNPNVTTVDVTLDGRLVGHINFDLWDQGRRRAANETRGIRNRTDWAGLVQRPVAHVSCRFQRDADGAERITFQNVHSLFHEFGHAINHLLIRKRLPNQSGLEYLPLERLEDLSMWFEKWVYHPEFGDGLDLSADERAGLSLCQRVKLLEYRRTHVDRAVTAALDLDLHRRPGISLRRAYERLDERYGVRRFSSLGDFPVYFTWPMFQANPGANFAYLWGAAASAEKFAPFADRPIGRDSTPAAIRARFADCFDYDQPSVTPDCDAVFAFYDRPRGLTGNGGDH